MSLKIQQGSTLVLDTGIKIEKDFNYWAVSVKLGEVIYKASAYDYPNTSEITNNDTFYNGVVDNVDIDVFTLSGSGHNGGYQVPYAGYYSFGALVNFFECRFAEHYTAIIRRWQSNGTLIGDYVIGKTISPIAFWADDYGITGAPLAVANNFIDYLNQSDSLLVMVKRNDYYSQKYYDAQGSTYEYEANNNTKASFNFKLNIAIVNPA